MKIKPFLVTGFNFLSRIFFILSLPFLYAAELFFPLRFGRLLEDRIGHLAANTLVFVRQREKNPPAAGRPARSFFIAGSPVNQTLVDLWRQQIPIVQSMWAKRFYLAVEPILERTRFIQKLPAPVYLHEEYSISEPLLRFSRAQEEFGRSELRRMGIGADDWFVCIHARDPAYLSQRTGFGTVKRQRHVRDCDIRSYFKAVEWLGGLGAKVVRMGAIVDGPLEEASPCLIDYATRFRSDFMDIYLSAKCRFFLGSSTGLWCVPMLFGVPLAGTNFIPLSDIGHGNRMLYIPKLIRKKDGGAYVSFSELRQLGLLDPQSPEYKKWCGPDYYADRGLEVIDNSSDEILDLCKDMIDFLEQKALPPEARTAQELFRGFYKGTAHDTPYAGKISPRFALRHRDLL